tara:strand:- start:7411 stop:7827 length:417 start_codon:yes stop_codon:yes gene_type:complete
MANKQFITYDTTKNMTVDLNPAFISGLQQIYGRYISEFYPDASEFGILIQDFNDTIMDPEKASKKNRKFTTIESELYTLYSIINILKSFAKQQGLEKLEDLKVTEEDFAKVMEDIKQETKDPTEMLNKLAAKLTELSS